mmetsp:Transcript_6751/g.16092  ORF Transcript_6751/g.16092 Transcript_6751/m.16092 type:complete len:243 (-) Transcript_6751:480-1208(-)
MRVTHASLSCTLTRAGRRLPRPNVSRPSTPPTALTPRPRLATLAPSTGVGLLRVVANVGQLRKRTAMSKAIQRMKRTTTSLRTLCTSIPSWTRSSWPNTLAVTTNGRPSWRRSEETRCAPSHKRPRWWLTSLRRTTTSSSGSTPTIVDRHAPTTPTPRTLPTPPSPTTSPMAVMEAAFPMLMMTAPASAALAVSNRTALLGAGPAQRIRCSAPGPAGTARTAGTSRPTAATTHASSITSVST